MGSRIEPPNLLLSDLEIDHRQRLRIPANLVSKVVGSDERIAVVVEVIDWKNFGQIIEDEN